MQLSLHPSKTSLLLLVVTLLGCDTRRLDLPADVEFWALAIGEEEQDEDKAEARSGVYKRVTLIRPPVGRIDLGSGRSVWFVEFASDPVRYGLEPGGKIELATCDPEGAFEIRTSRVRLRDDSEWVESSLPPDRRCLPVAPLSDCWEQSICATSIAGAGAACVDCNHGEIAPAVRPSAACPAGWLDHAPQLEPEVPEGFLNCRPERWNAEAPACLTSRLANGGECAPAVTCDPNFEQVVANGRPVVTVASQDDLDRAWTNLEPDSVVLVSAPQVVITEFPVDRLELVGVCPERTEVVLATDIASKEVSISKVSLRQSASLQVTDSFLSLRDVDWALAETVEPAETGVDIVRGRLAASGLRFSVRGVASALRVDSATVAVTASHFEGNADDPIIVDSRAASIEMEDTVFRVAASTPTALLAVKASNPTSFALNRVDFRGVRRALLVQESKAAIELRDVVGDFHTDDAIEQPPGLFAFHDVERTAIQGLYCETLGASVRDRTSCVLIAGGRGDIADFSTARVGHSLEVGTEGVVDINRMWSADYLRAGIQVPEVTPNVLVTLRDAFMTAVFVENSEANGNSVRGAVALRSIGTIDLRRVWIVSNGYHGVSVRAGKIIFSDLTVEDGQASALNTLFGGQIIGSRLHVRNVRRGLQLQSSSSFKLEDIVVEPVTMVESPDPSRLLDVNEVGGLIRNFRIEGVTPNRLDFSSSETMFENGIFRGVQLDTSYIDNFPAQFDNVGYEVTE